MKQQLVQLRLYEFNIIIKLFFLTPYLKVDYHFHDSYRIVILSTTRLNVKNFLELFFIIKYHITLGKLCGKFQLNICNGAQ